MSALAPRNWLPDERPGKPEIAIVALVLLDLADDFYDGEPVVWPWFAAGFLGCVIALGPLAASPVGAWVGDPFRGIGTAGRLLVVATFVVGTLAADAFDLLPSTPLSSVINGVLLAAAVVIVIRFLPSQFGE